MFRVFDNDLQKLSITVSRNELDILKDLMLVFPCVSSVTSSILIAIGDVIQVLDDNGVSAIKYTVYL